MLSSTDLSLPFEETKEEFAAQLLQPVKRPRFRVESPPTQSIAKEPETKKEPASRLPKLPKQRFMSSPLLPQKVAAGFKQTSFPHVEEKEFKIPSMAIAGLAQQTLYRKKPSAVNFKMPSNDIAVIEHKKPENLGKFEVKLIEAFGLAKDDETLRFLLGPALYHNDISQARDAINEAEWKLLSAIFIQEIIKQLTDGVDVFKTYLQNKALFVDTNSEKFTGKFKPYFEEIKKSHQNISKNILSTGLIGYKKWLKSHEGTLSLNIINTNLMPLAEQDLQSHDVFTQFFSLIRDLLSSVFTKDQLAPRFSQGRMGELFFRELQLPIEMLLNKGIKLFLTLQNFMKKIDEIQRETQKDVVKLTTQLRASQDYYLKIVASEINRYSKLANIWLNKEEKNPSDLFLTLHGSIESAEYSGLKRKSLIDLIIEYNLSCMQDPSKHIYLQDSYRENISKSIFSENVFFTTWLNPRFLQTLCLARRSKPAYQTISLKSNILQPLAWDQLNQLMAFVTCKSELQHFIKMNLQNYINSWNENNLIPYIKTWLPLEDSDQLVERRRQVEYLLGCLYLASAFIKDDGILYEDSRGYCSGISLILYQLQSRTSSLLFQSLKNIKEKIYKKEIMALSKISFDSLKTLRDQNCITAEEIFRRATQPTDQLIPINDIKQASQLPSNKLSVYRQQNTSTFFVIENRDRQQIFRNESEFKENQNRM